MGTCARAVCISATLAVLCTARVASTQAQDDPFVRQRDAEAAANESSGFSISFADSRRAFHPGETIPLVFTFRRLDVSPFNYEHCSGLGQADAVLDDPAGTTDPQLDLWANGIDVPVCGLLSGIIGGIVGVAGQQPLPMRPIEFRVDLNQGIRFDQPGRFRLYVRSHHRFLGQAGPIPKLISNILEFEILPRDTAWERRSLDDALRTLDSSADAKAKAEAGRTIRYLGTHDAVDETVERRLDTRGLYGAVDRVYVVNRMVTALDSPERQVSARFVSTLAILELTAREHSRAIDRAQFEATVRAYAIRRFTALKRANRLGQYLAEPGMLTPNGLPEAFAKFPDDVETTFSRLLPVAQRDLLESGRNWIVLHDPAFIPMLRRLAVGRDWEGPQAIALRLLSDLDPGEARRIALAELARHDSVVGISGLTVIPDRELPDLDVVFASSLEKARIPAEFSLAMDRIERFGTARILPRVRRAYERFPNARGCEMARRELQRVMTTVDSGPACYSGVFPPIADRRMSPAVEDAAIAFLSNSNPWIVSDATMMLERHGTARCESALWRALESIHDHPNMFGDDRWMEQVEWLLAQALTGNPSWLSSEQSVRRVIALTRSKLVESNMTQPLESATPATIRAYPPRLPHAEPTFSIASRAYVHASSRDALRRWLTLQPTGSAFTFEVVEPLAWRASVSDGWMPGESDTLYEETRRFVESRGMTLRFFGRPY
jgi:hypothetical protein